VSRAELLRITFVNGSQFARVWTRPLYFQKCRGVSLRQIRCDLIAGCQNFTKQVSECWILSAAHECLSMISRHGLILAATQD
jgi:hypothetical protein